MSDATTIQVHFGRAMPLFPLDHVTLLPQQVLPLHIFEPRYRQMVEHALDESGQIAMGVFEGEQWKQQYHGRPPVRPAVCVGQIVQHEKLPDGRYNLIVQGVCRGRIIEELPPDDERLYRRVRLEPVGVEDEPKGGLAEVRGELERAVAEGPLKAHRHADQLLEHIRNEEIPTPALLELATFVFVQPGIARTGGDLRYRLLAEPDPGVRARLILGELRHLSEMIRRASGQHPERWPKGVSWN